MIAFCVRCRAKREMQDIKPVMLKNGKRGKQGVCPECGCLMFSNAEETTSATYASTHSGK